MRNKKFAITGGVGSGKSTVCGILKAKGFPVLSCDEICANLWQEEEYLELLKKTFPDCVRNGKVSKVLISKLVFSDSDARKKLNAVSHSLIMARIFEQGGQYDVYFAEIPLLFESGYERNFDGVIVVLRDKDTRIESLKTRNGWSEEEILARMNSQFDYALIGEKKAVVIIRNDGTLSDLKKTTEEALKKLGF